MTRDEAEGMAWWNNMHENERKRWLERAGSARPADAWQCYKRERGEPQQRHEHDGPTPGM